MNSNRYILTTANRLVLTLYGGICVVEDWTNHQAAEPKLSVIFVYFLHFLFSIISHLWYNLRDCLLIFPSECTRLMHLAIKCADSSSGGSPCTIAS